MGEYSIKFPEESLEGFSQEFLKTFPNECLDEFPKEPLDGFTKKFLQIFQSRNPTIIIAVQWTNKPFFGLI